LDYDLQVEENILVKNYDWIYSRAYTKVSKWSIAGSFVSGLAGVA
jgi:hypothetical protein